MGLVRYFRLISCTLGLSLIVACKLIPAWRKLSTPLCFCCWLLRPARPSCGGCRITAALVQVLRRQVPFRLKARLLPAWRAANSIRRNSCAQGEQKLALFDKRYMAPTVVRLLR